jgi:hypothetical protein
MTNQPFRNETSQSERKATLNSDKAQHSTYHQRAISEAGQELGRFSKEQVITGSRSVPQYPRQHGTPWSEPDPSGTEPSLGYSVDAMEPIGGQPETVDPATSTDVVLPSSVDGRAVESAPATSPGADSTISRSLRGKV